MDVVRLPIGEQAPAEADCIRIEEAGPASFKLTASALCVGADDDESVSIVNAPMFKSWDEAEAAGLAWAEDVGVVQLFVSTGTLTQPLRSMEIDKPL